MEIYERLKEIRACNNMSQSDFASSLGIGQSTLGMMEVGKRNITDRHIKTICSIFSVDEHWLRTGEGSMHAETEVEIVDRLKAQYHMTDNQGRLMDIFLSMDGEKREQVATAFFSLVGEASKQTSSPSATDSVLSQADRDHAHVLLDQEMDAAEQDASASHSTARKKA
jgi:transcriptional regulator with XRE-family HTH domain